MDRTKNKRFRSSAPNTQNKKHCSNLQRTITKLDTLLLNNPTDWPKVEPLIRYILENYCQSIAGLHLLARSEFKDILLKLLAHEDLSLVCVNDILSVINNSVKTPELFEELLASPILQNIQKRYIFQSKNVFRSLRLLNMCFQKKQEFVVSADMINLIHKSVIDDHNKLFSEQRTVLQLVDFLSLFIHSCNIDNWNEVMLSLQIINIVIRNVLNSKESTELVVKSVELIKQSPVCLANELIKAKYHDYLEIIIVWLCKADDPRLADVVCDIYKGEEHLVYYLGEQERDKLFYQVLRNTAHVSHWKRILDTLYMLCQGGSYKYHLVNRQFCEVLCSILGHCHENITAAFTAIRIFLLFDMGGSIHKLAIESGLIVSVTQFVLYCVKLKNHSALTSDITSVFLLLKTSVRCFPDKHIPYELLYALIAIACLNESQSPYLQDFICLYLRKYINQNEVVGLPSLIYQDFGKKLMSHHLAFDGTLPSSRAVKEFSSINSVYVILSELYRNIRFFETAIDLEKFLSDRNFMLYISDSVLFLRNAKYLDIYKEKGIFRYVESYFLNGQALPLRNTIATVRYLLSNFRKQQSKMLFISNVFKIEDDYYSINHVKGKTIAITSNNSDLCIHVGLSNLTRVSSVFSAMFRHDFVESRHQTISFPYLSTESLHDFVSFIKSDFITSNIHNYEVACELFLFSILYQIPKLLHFALKEAEKLAFKSCAAGHLLNIAYKCNAPHFLLILYVNKEFDNFDFSFSDEEIKKFFVKETINYLTMFID